MSSKGTGISDEKFAIVPENRHFVIFTPIFLLVLTILMFQVTGPAAQEKKLEKTDLKQICDPIREKARSGEEISEKEKALLVICISGISSSNDLTGVIIQKDDSMNEFPEGSM